MKRHLTQLPEEFKKPLHDPPRKVVRVMSNGVLPADPAATREQKDAAYIHYYQMQESRGLGSGVPRRLTLVDEQANHKEQSSRMSEATCSHQFGGLTRNASQAGSLHEGRGLEGSGLPQLAEQMESGKRGDSNNRRQRIKLSFDNRGAADRNTQVDLASQRANQEGVTMQPEMSDHHNSKTRYKTIAATRKSNQATEQGKNPGSNLGVPSLPGELVLTKQTSFATSQDSSDYTAGGRKSRKSKTTNKTVGTLKTIKSNKTNARNLVSHPSMLSNRFIKAGEQRDLPNSVSEEGQFALAPPVETARAQAPSVIQKLLDKGFLTQEQIACLRLLERGQSAPLGSKTTLIQKLLKKDYLTEEQFICLLLLDKGYIP